MATDLVTSKKFRCGTTNGQLVRLRHISRVIGSGKNVLKVLKEEVVISKLEKILVKMGLKRLSTCFGRIIKACHRFLNGSLVSIILNGIPVGIAVLQDKGIGKNVMVQIANMVGCWIGEAVGGLIAGALSGVLVPLVVKVGGMLGFVAITEVTAGAIVGAAITGIGSFIGMIIGGLIGLGVYALTSYIRQKTTQTEFPSRLRLLSTEEDMCLLKSKLDYMYVPTNREVTKTLTKRDLEGPPLLKSKIEPQYRKMA